MTVKKTVYRYSDGYKHQLELAGVMWHQDTNVVIERVKQVGTHRAYRALRAMFKSYQWEFRDDWKARQYFQRCAERAELRAEQIKFEAR